MDLTYEQIIEVLEHCISASDVDTIDDCKGCLLDEECGKDCDALLKTALEFIKYQNAEIERWRANYTLPKEGFFNVLCGALVYTKTLEEYNQFRRTIKAEVVKGFAERLKEKYKKDFNSTWHSVYNPIDNLVKEMVGD